MKKYKALASMIQARKNCLESNNQKWFEKHGKNIQKIIGSLPHGSGIDGETGIDLTRSTSEKIIIFSSFHCMNGEGYYDGWSDFTIKIIPSLQFDFELKITGNFGKYSDIKEYLYNIFDADLREESEVIA